MTYLVAPSERPPISSMGTSSLLPERMGADILWHSPHGLAGVQRKRHDDLIASVRDTRLGMELVQMQLLHTAMVVIEGQPSWTADGQLLTQHTQWSLKQQRGVEWSIQSQGVMVCWTRNPAETVSAVEHLYERTQQADHVSSLLARGKAQKNGWGKLSDEATAVHVLSGFPGISTELATRLFKAFGRAPIGLTVTADELLAVPGIGPKRVAQLLKCLGTSTDLEGSRDD